MQKTLTLAVFTAGMTSLGIEMAASHLVGNTFGTSNLVWASIIGLILIFLAVGYFLGGRWADRSPHPATFYRILIWAALSTAAVPLVADPILKPASRAFDALQIGVLAGSFISVLILLIVPMTLLGTASPFAIRLAVASTPQVGETAGRMYAISTLGSFLGTFLPVLVLIPQFGTRRTFFTFSLLLLLVGLAGLVQAWGWRKSLPYLWTPFLVLALLIWGSSMTTKDTPGQVYETESGYNYIQVLQRDGYTMLRLNEGQGIHSIYHPTELRYNGPWELMLVAPFFNAASFTPQQVTDMAIVGLAAGTTARQATAVFGPLAIDGFEIDPKIVDVGRRFFDMNEPNLNVVVEDGRVALQHSDRRYQLITMDAYRPPYIPPHLTTVEFFALVRQHLTDDGAIAINVGRAPGDRRLIDGLAATVRTSFPSVYVVDIPDTFNSIIYATVQPGSVQNLYDNLARLNADPQTHPLLKYALQIAAANLAPAPLVAEPYTDDRAPIELITNDMVLRFLLNGDTETVQ